MLPKFRMYTEIHGIKQVSSIIFYDNHFYVNFRDGYNVATRVKNPMLMQSSELKDKNGVEIYAGDIVRFEHDDTEQLSEVFFQNGCFQVSVQYFESVYIGSTDITNIEVIGNIYENRDLM